MEDRLGQGREGGREERTRESGEHAEQQKSRGKDQLDSLIAGNAKDEKFTRSAEKLEEREGESGCPRSHVS